MAAVQGDIIQVTDIQNYLGQEVLNVYYYSCDDNPTTGYLDGLSTEWQETVLPAVRALQHVLLTHVGLRLENIFNGDLLEIAYATPLPGTQATGTTIAEATPSYTAMVFSLKRQNTRVRNGRKSIAGLPEGFISGNNIVSATTALANIAAAMGSQLVAAGGLDAWTPAIVGRVPYTTVEGNPAYRLPTSQAEMDDNFSLVDNVSSSTVISTMNTRKPGRGS